MTQDATRASDRQSSARGIRGRWWRLPTLAIVVVACTAASASAIGTQAVPDAPILLSASVDGQSQVVVAGTSSAPDAAVTIYVDGVFQGMGGTHADGHFDFVAASPDAPRQPPGFHVVTATVTVDGAESAPSNGISAFWPTFPPSVSIAAEAQGLVGHSCDPPVGEVLENASWVISLAEPWRFPIYVFLSWGGSAVPGVDYTEPDAHGSIATVPAGATSILLIIPLTATAAGKTISLTAYGATDGQFSARVLTDFAYNPGVPSVVVACPVAGAGAPRFTG